MLLMARVSPRFQSHTPKEITHLSRSRTRRQGRGRSRRRSSSVLSPIRPTRSITRIITCIIQGSGSSDCPRSNAIGGVLLATLCPPSARLPFLLINTLSSDPPCRPEPSSPASTPSCGSSWERRRGGDNVRGCWQAKASAVGKMPHQVRALTLRICSAGFFGES